MPNEYYRILHFGGIFLLMLTLGGVCVRSMLSGASGNAREFPQRKWLGMMHGIALLLILVAGMGMVAKNHLVWQPWLSGKLAVWFALAVAPTAIYARPNHAKSFLVLSLALACVAAWLAGAKPF